MGRVVLFAQDVDGNALTGQTLAWDSAFKTSDWSTFGSPPSFTELGGGLYYFDEGATEFAGIVDMGSGATPRYVVYEPDTNDWAVVGALDSSAETPDGGLSPTWSTWYKDVAAGDTTGDPSILAAGSGVYYFDTSGISTHAVGVIDFGAGAVDRYVQWDNEAGTDATAPTIDNFSPSTGTTITSTQQISFDITDDEGFSKIVVIASFGDIVEVIHDGDQFRGNYTDSPNARSSISGGFSYTVLRRGGWPSSPTLEFHVVDTSANLGTI